jgi:transposase
VPTTKTTLTPRQREIKARLDTGMGAREIAEDLGVTRNAVYEQIKRLRRNGIVDPSFTPSGLPTREHPGPGEATLARLLEGAAQDTEGESAAAGALALVAELRRTRDELDAISRRLAAVVPR